MKKPLMMGCLQASMAMPPSVEEVMSTVRSRIICGSRMSPIALSLYQTHSF